MSGWVGVNGGTARARGIGEVLRPLRLKTPFYAVVVKPRAGVPTAEAFRRYRASAPLSISMVEFALMKGDIPLFEQYAGNALGILGKELLPEQRTRLGLQKGEGVLVAQVKGDAARNAGLQAGDVVLAVGRTDVGSVAALDAQLRAVGTGKPVMLLVQRGGGTRYMAINPAEG